MRTAQGSAAAYVALCHNLHSSPVAISRPFEALFLGGNECRSRASLSRARRQINWTRYELHVDVIEATECVKSWRMQGQCCERLLTSSRLPGSYSMTRQRRYELPIPVEDTGNTRMHIKMFMSVDRQPSKRCPTKVALCHCPSNRQQGLVDVGMDIEHLVPQPATTTAIIPQ